MVQKYFNKPPLQNIDVREVVAKGAVLSFYKKDLKISDITTKAIGISIKGEKMGIIIPSGTPIILRKGNLLLFKQAYNLETQKKVKNITIKIYQGNDKFVKNNEYLGEFNFDIKDSEKNVKIIISMLIDYNSILKVNAFVNDKKKKDIGIKMKYNY